MTIHVGKYTIPVERLGMLIMVQVGGRSSIVRCPKAMSEIMAQAEIEARDFVEQKAPQTQTQRMFNVCWCWDETVGLLLYICVTL